jgi:hypothetical protein
VHNSSFRKWLLIVTLSALVLLPPFSLALAQSGGGYDLGWSSVDGGGYIFSTGNGYALGGTIGQPDAGVLSGDGYTLNGGFWGGAAAEYRIYLPMVVRQ